MHRYIKKIDFSIKHSWSVRHNLRFWAVTLRVHVYEKLAVTFREFSFTQREKVTVLYENIVCADNIFTLIDIPHTVSKWLLINDCFDLYHHLHPWIWWDMISPYPSIQMCCTFKHTCTFKNCSQLIHWIITRRIVRVSNKYFVLVVTLCPCFMCEYETEYG